MSGVVAVGLVSLVMMIGSNTRSASAATSSLGHTVPLSCQFGDQRTVADASVTPGVIVPDFSGFPFLPVTYTAFSIDGSGNLEVIGASSTIVTEDHLVAAWQNSTNCFGSSISRNAWVADSSGTVFGESDFSGPPAELVVRLGVR